MANRRTFMHNKRNKPILLNSLEIAIMELALEAWKEPKHLAEEKAILLNSLTSLKYIDVKDKYIGHDTKEIKNPSVKKYHVGRGWWALLDEYIPRIEALGAKLDTSPYEKYGTLRVSACPYSDDIDMLIDELEDKSSKICERCGDAGGEVVKNGWTKTLCGNCHKIWTSNSLAF
jgi:hypothetical protein